MKLAPAPSTAALKKAYEQLEWNPQAISAEQLVKWALWSRIDARLAELVVRHLSKYFWDYNPLLLGEENQRSQPQALAVLVEFTKRLIPTTSRNRFQLWQKALTQKIAPASPQMFFLRQGMPRPEKDFQQIETTLRPYRRWGYFGNETIGGHKSPAAKITLLGKAERARTLRKLLREKKFISVRDYITACNGQVHPRTAERDLAENKNLLKKGATRGRTYRRKPGRLAS